MIVVLDSGHEIVTFEDINFGRNYISVHPIDAEDYSNIEWYQSDGRLHVPKDVVVSIKP